MSAPPKEKKEPLNLVASHPRDKTLLDAKEEQLANSFNCDISALPIPSTALIGRNEQLQQLDNYLIDLEVEVVGITGMGGMGKSALVSAWLDGLIQDPKAIRKIFAWSFNKPDRSESDSEFDVFFKQVTDFLEGPSTPPKVSHEQADLLITILKQQPTILILDGWETMQDQITLWRFLNLLAAEAGDLQGKGLVVTTAIQQTNMEQEHRYREIQLKPLDEDAGVKLLHSLEVTTGPKEEFPLAVQEWWGHPLSLVLLGRLLAKNHNGEILRRDQVTNLLVEPGLGSHAIQAMTWYDHFFDGPEAKDGSFLRLLGLFDRAMEERQIWALLENENLLQLHPDIKGLKFYKTVPDLKATGLLIAQEEGNTRTWDAHPLARLVFRQLLKEENPDLFLFAHLMLFEYFKEIAKPSPETLEEIQPLFRAIYHGCQAGEYEQAVDVLQRLISGEAGKLFYRNRSMAKQLLTACASFFPEGWTQSPVFREMVLHRQSFLLNVTSDFLWIQKRLWEALPLAKTAMQVAEQINDWGNASICAGQVSRMTSVVGELPEALEAAQQAVQWAKRIEDPILIATVNTYLANILTLMGELENAGREYCQVEDLWDKRSGQKHYGIHYHGDWYSFLLLEQNLDEKTRATIQEKAEQMMAWGKENGNVFYSVGGYVLLGRILTATNRFSEARQHMDQVVEYARQGAHINYTTYVLTLRAALLRQMDEKEQASKDVSEILEICQWSGMLRHEVDARLVEINLLLDQGDVKAAKKPLQRAETLIKEIGYGLRLSQLKMAYARYAWHTGNAEKAMEHLADAKKRIEEIGQWGRMPEWEIINAEISNPIIPPESKMFSPTELIDLIFGLVLSRNAHPELLQNPTVEALDMGLKKAEVEPHQARQLIISRDSKNPAINANPLWRAWLKHARSQELEILRQWLQR